MARGSYHLVCVVITHTHTHTHTHMHTYITIMFLQSQVSDGGVYECRASNEAGSDQLTFNVAIYGKLAMC